MKRIIAFLLVLALLFTCISCGGGDKGNAKSVAKEYCKMLQSQHNEIESINFTGDDRIDGDTYYFEVKVNYSGSSQEGEVECYKDSEGDYVCNGLMFY
ncbi:MAG: hypothetical protein IKF07_05155 [Eubacterium sp.]|nr:hypothetical protein [Eubacterium sp.]